MMQVPATRSAPVELQATGAPWRSSTSAGVIQDESGGPVAMGCQISSGVPGPSNATGRDRRPCASHFTVTMDASLDVACLMTGRLNSVATGP